MHLLRWLRMRFSGDKRKPEEMLALRRCSSLRRRRYTTTCLLARTHLSSVHTAPPATSRTFWRFRGCVFAGGLPPPSGRGRNSAAVSRIFSRARIVTLLLSGDGAVL